MGNDGTRENGEAAMLDAARQEMERAAVDLEGVTARLRECTERVDWLEALVDELLGLLAVPALVLDRDGCILAMSRGAERQLDDPDAALGRSAASVLPRPLADTLTLVVALPGESSLVVSTK
jgi:PAS domain-containing protein